MKAAQAMKPEQKSDRFDQKIVAIPAKELSKMRFRNALAVATLAFVIVGFISMFVILRGITRDTNYAVTSQIPGLQQQIRARDKTIRDQQSVIEQAVEVITKLARQVQALGGDPGTITISPPKEE
jgi:hypothetical protein